MTIDAGPNLAGTLINVDGGVGNDDFIVNALAEATRVAGGDNEDTVKVFIPDLPTADQFTNLGVDIETLIVDNSTSTIPTAWDLTDAELAADQLVGVPLAPAGSPVDVLIAEGAETLRLLAGAGEDTLNVATNTLAEVKGTIEDNVVDLQFGSVILAPSEVTTFAQPQVGMSFDGLLDSLAKIEQNGLVLSIDGAFVPGASAGVGATTNADRFTLRSADGGPLSLASIDLASTLAGFHEVDFVGIRGNGFPTFFTAGFDGNTGFQTFNLSPLGDALYEISWTLPTGALLDNIVVNSREFIEFNDMAAAVGTSSYSEKGFDFTTNDQFNRPSALALATGGEQVTLSAGGAAFDFYAFDVFGGTLFHEITFIGMSVGRRADCRDCRLLRLARRAPPWSTSARWSMSPA